MAILIKRLPCAYEKASCLSKLFFVWCWRFFISNYNHDLSAEDLYECPRSDISQKLGDKVETEWEKQLLKKKIGKKPSLFFALTRIFGPAYILMAILLAFMQAIQITQTICLGQLMNKLGLLKTDKDTPELRKQIYLWAFGVIICQIGAITGLNPYYFCATRLGMRMRVACSSMIYKKALKLSSAAFHSTTVGQIVNLLSNDVNRFDIGPGFPPFMIIGPLSTAATVAILWEHLNIWSVAGIAILLLYIPLQTVMGKAFSKLRSQTAKLTDERVRLMNEFIPAMRVIKMYTWEKPFADLVDKARKREVAKIRWSSILRGFNLGMFWVASKVIVFVMILLFVRDNGRLTAEIVFMTMALINMVRLSMTLFFPYAISTGAEAYISIKRIEKFLLLPEAEQSDKLDKTSFPNRADDAQVSLKNVVAKWSEKENASTLENISCTIKPGNVLVIVGPVGSGKSSTLMTILGEIPLLSGSVEVRGKISYASQEPWTFAGSVKDNILFGSEFDEEKYKRVINVAALERDLKILPHGDQTIVGDRGVSLSGGQRARVNLARALYSDADIYLLDDPLSAVDASVAKHIFEKSIKHYLRKKIVILVTHQVQFIKAASQILLLDEGKMAAYGTFQELSSKGIDFIKFSGQSKEGEGDEFRKRSSTTLSNSSELHAKLTESQSISSLAEDMPMTHYKKVSFVEESKPESREMKESTSSSANYGTYWLFVKYGTGIWALPVIILIFICTQSLFTGNDWWISLWTNSEQRNSCLQDIKANITNEDCNKKYPTSFVDQFTKDQNMVSYSVQISVLFILSNIRTTVFFVMCMRASIMLHDKLFRSIVRAPISFFDNNPIGILLNRCSRDMGIIDDIIPPTGFDAVGILSMDTGIAIMLACLQPYNLLPTLILLTIFYFIRKLYIGTARSIKKLEGSTKSPVFSHISTSLYGLLTIRAFGAQNRFVKQFDTYQDGHTSAWFMYLASSRWFILVLDWLCVMFISAVTISLTADLEKADGATVGLAITSAIGLSGGFQWGIRQLTELETQMTSVERVDEYSALPVEGRLETAAERKPPPNWPQYGAISFEDVTLHYFEDEPAVLNNLTFEVKPKEKIGVVGRTGAGKSSIIGALFRMTECRGMISIDDVDTKILGLHDLRRKISIIPQEPTLFSGTVRYNLDPFAECSDEKLWAALEAVQLKPVIKSLTQGLDSNVTESGGNFSVGQRQLICLARAILRENKILVLDEATANVDPKTDSLIQSTIRTVFADCTILTIAHRLNTVMDSDRILVMDAGKLVEYDEPYELLKNKDGYLYSMAQATGKDMLQTLVKLARSAASKKHNHHTKFTVTHSDISLDLQDSSNSISPKYETSKF